MYALAEASKSVDARLVQGSQKPELGLHLPTRILKYKKRECGFSTSAFKETCIIWSCKSKAHSDYCGNTVSSITNFIAGDVYLTYITDRVPSVKDRWS